MPVHVRRFGAKLLVLAAGFTPACLAASSEAPGDDTGEDTQAADTGENTSSEPQACELRESSTNPEVTLAGRLCGETVNITTRAGTLLHLGRSSAADPENEIRIVEVLDARDPNAAASLADSQFLLNLGFETGPEFASGVSTHTLTSGVFSLCGFGTVVFLEGPVTFDFAEVGDGIESRRVDLSLSGLVVSGYSERHGQERVDICGGELDLRVTGELTQ